MYKKAILIIAVGVFACLFWFWAKPWIDSPARFLQVGIWLKPLIMFAILTSAIGLSFLLIKDYALKILTSVLVGLPFFFVFGFNQFYLGAFVLMILLFMYGMRNVQAEAGGRTKINIRIIMQRGLPRIVTAMLVMISFAFFFSPNIQASAKNKQLPPSFKQVIERTVDSFLGGQVKNLSLQEKQQVKSQTVSQVLEQFTAFLGPYIQYLPPILAFGLFLILQGLSFIFVWLGVAIATLIFWALKRSGFVRIGIEQKEAERIDF
jgi:hypothetical protein